MHREAALKEQDRPGADKDGGIKATQTLSGGKKMAINSTKQVRAKACPENSVENTEAGQQASPQRASDVVIRLISERKPALPLLDHMVPSQRKATAPGSPGNRTVEEAGNELSNYSCPNSPMPNKVLRQIDRLLGGDNDKGPRSLLRLYGNDVVSSNDPLAQLNIMWLVDAREPIAPGKLSRATPPPGAMPLVAGSPPSLPAAAAAEQRKQSLRTAAEALFHYPGPGDQNLGNDQWLLTHPLHRMFRQVYPLHGATGSLEQPIDTPMHTVLEGGIRNPLNFYHSLMVICEQADNRFTELETLYRNAVAVSRNADGLLREQADFFSRFFSALIALRTVQDQNQRTNIVETLRQEWLETDFGLLFGHPEASPPQAQWQAAEPARTQVSGRRTFADAIGHGDMPPQKKQKTVRHQEASTTAGDEQPASARQSRHSHRHASPQTSDADSDTDLSPPSDKYRRPAKPRSGSWKASLLKRQSKLSGRKFDAKLADIAINGMSASPIPAQQSSVQQAGNPPVSGNTMKLAEPHEKTLSN
jgi:hypothetical protein